MVDRDTEISPIATVQFTHNDAVCWPPPPPDWAGEFGASNHRTGTSTGVQSSKAVHVWAASLQVPPQALKAFAASLSPEERQRAARFHFPIHRDRFIAGRGLLRKLLATYLETEPSSLQFSYSPQGKPALTGATRKLDFNVAHSEDLVLIVVTCGGMIGVDVEQVRLLPDFEELVDRFFSHNESSQFCGLPAAQKPTAFFNLWTRKEAWLKATGEGITHLLNQVEVSFLPGEPARLLRLPAAYANNASWVLHELAPQPGFTAALAFFGDAPAIHCWHLHDR